ncbi:MAG: hypothetical protein E7072_11015 [Bacteroidales bacterium]|nr:hypothetical protein [Bacteroidales bacterium]
MIDFKSFIYPISWENTICANEFYNFKTNGKYIINNTKYDVKIKGDKLVLKRRRFSMNCQEPTLCINIEEMNVGLQVTIIFMSPLFLRIILISMYTGCILAIIFSILSKVFIGVGIAFALICYSAVLTNFINYKNTSEILSDLKTLCK